MNTYTQIENKNKKVQKLCKMTSYTYKKIELKKRFIGPMSIK